MIELTVDLVQGLAKLLDCCRNSYWNPLETSIY